MIYNNGFLKRNTANFITLFRILGVVMIFWLTPYKNNYYQVLAIYLFIIVALTDLVDGWYARKYKIVSDVGKILDPLADKILILVFLPLLEMQTISSFPVFIILAREFAIMALRIFAAKDGQIMPARLSGKIKTAFQLPLCGILLGRVHVPNELELNKFADIMYSLIKFVQSWPMWIIYSLTYITVIITVVSFFDYVREYLWHYMVQKEGSEERLKRKLRTLIPNSFSLSNLLCGMIGSILALNQQYNFAVISIILGVFFDSFDGPLARKLDAYSKLGARLDSKADLVSFGIAPACMILTVLRYGMLKPGIIPFIISAFYFLAVFYRLKRFDDGGHSDSFTGLPSPVGAAIVLIAGISVFLKNTWIFSIISIIVSILMVSNIQYFHLGIIKKKKFYFLLAILSATASLFTILKLLDTKILSKFYAYEFLLSVILIYVFSPAIGMIFPSLSAKKFNEEIQKELSETVSKDLNESNIEEKK